MYIFGKGKSDFYPNPKVIYRSKGTFPSLSILSGGKLCKATVWLWWTDRSPPKGTSVCPLTSPFPELTRSDTTYLMSSAVLLKNITEQTSSPQNYFENFRNKLKQLGVRIDICQAFILPATVMDISVPIKGHFYLMSLNFDNVVPR